MEHCDDEDECACELPHNLGFESWLVKYVPFNQSRCEAAKKEYEKRSLIDKLFAEAEAEAN
jgi:hypothetical protein